MKIFIIIIILILILLTMAYFAIGNYFYNIALNPEKLVLAEENQEEYEEEQEDWISENSIDVYIDATNNGNLKLHGYELVNKNNSDIWAIVIHGYMGHGKGMTYYAKEFYNMGYNVLVVDLRGHGKSEGKYIGMGWHDRLDIMDWTDYLINKNSNCEIILHGISMGAATVMMATGENLPSNVKVAIEDCGYTSIWDEFEVRLKEMYGLPTFPVLNAADSICKTKAGYKFEEGSSVEQVKKSKTPTLFIHGDLDTFVPFEMLDKVYNAANCTKEKLVIEGAAHAEAASVNPELYWKTVKKFIEKNI